MATTKTTGAKNESPVAQHDERDDVAVTTANGTAYAGMSDKERLQAMRAEKKAILAAAKEAAKKKQEEIAALAPLASRAPAKTVDDVDKAQAAAVQIYIVRSIVGRVQDRMRVGQDRQDAMRAVLAKCEEWAWQELAEREARQAAKDALKTQSN